MEYLHLSRLLLEGADSASIHTCAPKHLNVHWWIEHGSLSAQQAGALWKVKPCNEWVCAGNAEGTGAKGSEP